jgi:uncharacterized protein YjiS (DUF1127 family)
MFGIKNKIKEWNKYNRTLRELASLTDRELNDIGITRHDIRWIAANSK